jgi:hypothetical protein
MGFRVYDYNANSVYTKSGDKASADVSVSDLINDTHSLYINLNNLSMAAKVRVNYPGAGTRKYSYACAEYSSEERPDLITGLVKSLDELDSESEWEVHNQGEDIDDRLPWLLDSVTPRSPAELGFTNVDKESIKHSLREGDRLDIGVSGYEQAAELLKYFILETNLDISICISSAGRITEASSVSSSNLVLIPAGYDELTLVNDTVPTEENVQSKRETTLQEIRREYKKAAIEHIDSLYETEDRSVWRKYRELCKVEEILKSYADAGYNKSENQDVPDLETELGRRATELIRSVVTGEDPETSNVTYSPEILKDEEDYIQDIVEGVYTKAVQRREDIEDGMADLVRDQLFSELEVFDERISDPSSRHSYLTETLDIINKKGIQGLPSDSDSTVSFRDYLGDLEKNTQLTASQKQRIRDEIKNELSDKIEDIEEQRIQKYDNRFQEHLEELLKYDTVEDIEETVLETEEVRQFVSDPPVELGDSDHIRNFDSLFREIESDDILDDKTKSKLKKKYDKALSERHDEFVDKAIQKHKELIADAIDELEESTNKNGIRILKLREAREVITTGESFVENKFDNAAKYDVFNEVRSDTERILSDEVLRLENSSVLTEEKIEDIKSTTRRLISDKRVENKQRIKEDIKGNIKAYINSGSRDNRGFVDSIFTKDALEIDEINKQVDNVRQYKSKNILSSSDVVDVENFAREKVEEKRKSLRDAEYTEIENSIERSISYLHDTCEDSTEIDLFKYILQDYFNPNNEFSYSSSPDELGGDIEQEAKSLLREINRLNKGETTLLREDEKELLEKTKQLLKEDLEEARENYTNKRLESIKTKISEIADTPEDDYNRLERGLERLESLCNFIKETSKNTRRQPESDAEGEIIDFLNDNKIRKKHRFRQKLLKYTKNLERDKRQTIREYSESSTRDILDNIRNGSSPSVINHPLEGSSIKPPTGTLRQIEYLEKMYTLMSGNDEQSHHSQLKTILDRGTSREITVDETIRRQIDRLETDTREQLKRDIENDIQELCGELASEINNEVNHLMDNGEIGERDIEIFRSYVEGDTERSPLPERIEKSYDNLVKLHRRNILSDSKFGQLRDRIKDDEEDAPRPPRNADSTTNQELRPSNALAIGAIGILIGLTVAAAAGGIFLFISGGGSSHSPVITDVSSSVLVDNGTELSISIEGQVDGAGQVRISMTDSGANETVSVTNGTFSGTLPLAGLGSYTAELIPVLNDTEGGKLIISGDTSRGLILQPIRGQEVNGSVSISALADADRYRILLLRSNMTVVPESEGQVEDGLIETRVNVSGTTQHIVLLATEDEEVIGSDITEVSVTENSDAN